MAHGDGETGIAVTLPPRVRGLVEALALDLSLDKFGRVALEFEIDKGRLERTFVKLGPIKNTELEQLAIALTALRAA